MISPLLNTLDSKINYLDPRCVEIGSDHYLFLKSFL